MPEETNTNLSIYLLKSNQTAAFEKKYPKSQGLLLADPLEGMFFPFQSESREPDWVADVRRILQEPDRLRLMGQSPAGLMVVGRNGRTFVVTFGYAWLKLDDRWIEPHFGRKVALNCVPRHQILELRTEQVFGRWHIASERAPSAAMVDEFGVEFDRDLVGAVEGNPEGQPILGKVVRGAASLRVSVPISTLGEVLDAATLLHQSSDYKKIWPELDHIQPVKDETVIGCLEDQMDRDFTADPTLKKLVLFTPDFRREYTEKIDSYVFGKMTRAPAAAPYLTVAGWLSWLSRVGRFPSVAEAKVSKVHLLDESKKPIRACSVFDCFGYEVSLNSQPYILSSGVWYEVTLDFVKEVNARIKRILKPKIVLPVWNQKDDEGDYNKRCAKRDSTLLCFDAKNLWYGGGQSRFEWCDLVHLDSKTLVFAKVPSRSSGMSHLYEQARRTSDLFFNTDGEYRKKLKKVFEKQYPSAPRDWLDKRPNNQDWNFCLLSLGKRAEELPFFAKCGLMRVHKELTNRGHEVSFTAV